MVGLHTKTYSYLKDNTDGGKKSSRYKKMCCKKKT